MIFGRAIAVAGSPAGALCIRTTGFDNAPPSFSARRTMRFTQYADADPAAFQSSVSTDHNQTAVRRRSAMRSVVAS